MLLLNCDLYPQPVADGTGCDAEGAISAPTAKTPPYQRHAPSGCRRSSRLWFKSTACRRQRADIHRLRSKSFRKALSEQAVASWYRTCWLRGIERMRNEETKMDKKHHINLWYVIAAIILLFLFQGWYATWRTVEPIPYSEFEQFLKDGKIAEIQVGEQRLVGQFKKPLKDGRAYFTTNRVDPAIADGLTKWREIRRHGQEHLPERPAVLGDPHRLLL
jgi:hypothetical protein